MKIVKKTPKNINKIVIIPKYSSKLGIISVYILFNSVHVYVISGHAQILSQHQWQEQAISFEICSLQSQLNPCHAE